jgi:tetratricopeptide (TPR) repeat protein
MIPLKSDQRINRLLKLFTRLFPIFLLLGVIVGLTVEKKIIIALSLPFSIIVSVFALFIIEILGNVSGSFYWPSKKVNHRQELSAYLAKAKFSKGNGRFKDALSIINEVLDKDPDFPDALYLKGQILWEGFENSVESKKLFSRVMQLLSTEEELYYWSSYYIDKISVHDKTRVDESSSDDN